MAGGIQVKLIIVRANGQPDARMLEVPIPGVPLRVVLAQAKIDPEGKYLFVDDKPATLDSLVGHGQGVLVTTPQAEETAEKP